MRRFAILSLAIRPARTPAASPEILARAVLCIAVYIVAPCAARAGDTHYKFVSIATESASLRLLDNSISINSSGAVAFFAAGPNGPTIFTGSGGPLTTVADSSGPFSAVVGPAVINDSGTVAFVGHPTDREGARGIYKVTSGGTPVPIVEGSFGEPYLVVGRQSINAVGTVAFVAAPVGGNYGVYKGDGGPLTLIAGADAGNFLPFSTSISASGVVAFLDQSTLFAGGGGTVSPLVSGELDHPSINASGSISFATPGGVMIWKDGGLQSYANANGPFSSFGGGFGAAPLAPINDVGIVAFVATEDVGYRGLYVGPNPDSDAVIRQRDTLFGSYLEVLESHPAISSRGDVAFRYRLANGTTGIAAAIVVPEPGIGVLVAMSFACVAARRREVCLTPLG